MRNTASLSTASVQQAPAIKASPKFKPGFTQVSAGPQRTSRLARMEYAVARFFETKTPQYKRTQRQEATAWKTADQQLGKAIELLASGKGYAAGAIVVKDIAATLKPVTDKATGQPRDASQLRGELLRHRLSNMETGALEKLNAGLDELKKEPTDPVGKTQNALLNADPAIKQLITAVKSELLHRKMAEMGLDGDGWEKRWTSMDIAPREKLLKLKDLRDLASQIMSPVSTGKTSHTVLPGARHTQNELADIEGYGHRAVIQLEQRAAVSANKATAAEMDKMSGADLKELKGDVDFLIEIHGKNADPAHLTLQKTVADRIKVADHKVTEQLLGRGVFNADSLSNAKLRSLSDDITQLNDKPEAVADAEKVMRATMEKRKNSAQALVQNSLQAAVRKAGGNGASTALNDFLKSAEEATKTFSALGQALASRMDIALAQGQKFTA